jgi:hypothetical protein
MSRWSPADEPMGSWIPHVPRSDWYSTVPAEDSRPIPHWRYNRLIKSVRGELRGRAEVVGAVWPCRGFWVSRWFVKTPSRGMSL